MQNWNKYDNFLKALSEAKEEIAPSEIIKLIYKVMGFTKEQWQEEIEKLDEEKEKEKQEEDLQKLNEN